MSDEPLLSEYAKPWLDVPVTPMVMGWHGISLRDFFASQIASTMLTHRGPPDVDEVWAHRVYQLADAMLEARKK
jgi:hypothetical protein